jgi:hypothetical protein
MASVGVAGPLRGSGIVLPWTLVLLPILTGSCVEEGDLTALELPVPVTVSLVPVLDGDLANTAASLRLGLALVEASFSGAPAEGGDAVIALDPDALPSAVQFRFDLLPGAEVSLEGSVELVHEEEEGGSVEWAVFFGPFTVSADQEAWEFPVPFGRGNLAEQSITDLILTGATDPVVEGAVLQFSAAVEGGPEGARIFWGSRSPGVATVDGMGTVTTLLPGSTDITVAAGPHARSLTLQVLQALATLEVSPSDVVLGSVGEEATFTAIVRDPRGVEVTDRELDLIWGSDDPLVAASLGAGVFQAVRSGSTEIFVRVEDLEARATIMVDLELGSLAIVEGDGQTGEVGAQLDPFVVRVLDGAGGPIIGAIVEWSVVAGEGDLSSATSLSGEGGLADVVYTLGTGAGTHEVRASLVGSPLEVTFTATAEAGAPAALVAVSGAGQSGQAGVPLPAPLVVQVEDAFGNPVSGAAVTWEAGTGSVEPGSGTSDEEGLVSTVWTPGGALGPQTTTAFSGELDPVSFEAQIGPGVPAVVLVVEGGGQEGPVEEALPEPIVVEVQDAFENTVEGVTVTWEVEQGSIDPATSETGENGRAQASWTLGAEPGSVSGTATVSGLDPAVFTATAIPGEPFIRLELVGDDRLGVDREATLRVTLRPETDPDGNGATVELSVDDPTRLELGQTTLFVPPGESVGEITVTGLAAGNTTIRATAAGYLDGALPIEVTLRIISLPTTLNVAFGGTASIPVQLAEPAPAGGIVVALLSDNPEAVGIVTPTVTIPEGQLTVNGTVSGVTPGTATITATHPDYVSGVSQAATTAALQIVEASLTINESFGGTVRVRLTSAGSPVAAPAPGVVVALAAASPGCLAVPAEATIATGLSEVVVPITWGGEAETQCTSSLAVSAPDITGAQINVTVNPVPGFTLTAITTGAGLQRSISGFLGASNHGGTTVTLTSSNPEVVLLAPSATTPGAASIQIPILSGSTSFTYWVQGLEGVDGEVTVTASSPGFSTQEVVHTVVAPSMDVLFLPAATTTLSGQTPFQARAGLSNAGQTGMSLELQARAGGPGVPVVVRSTELEVGRLVTSDVSGDSVLVVIPAGGSRSPGTVGAGGVAFDPQGPGTTTVSLSSPGWVPVTTSSLAVTVAQPQITVNSTTTGSGLQRAVSGSLGAAAHGGVTLTLTSSDPEILLVSPNASTAGAPSFDLSVPDGTANFTFWVQGVEGATGEVPVLGSAPGFSALEGVQTVVTGALDIIFLTTTTTTLAADDPFVVRLGLPNGQLTGLSLELGLRAGGPGALVSVTSSEAEVGRLATLEAAGDSVTTTIAPGLARSPGTVAAGGVAFDAQGPGTTTVRASIPGFITTDPAGSPQVTVTASQISLTTTTTGAGLQRSVSGNLGTTAHGGVTVTLTSGDPEVLLLSPNGSTEGAPSLQLSIPDGTSTFTYWVQGVEGTTGQVSVTGSAPGFVDGVIAHSVVTAALDIIFLGTSPTTLSPDDPFQVRLGLPNGQNTTMVLELQLRAGGPGATATITSSNPSVGRLVTTAVTGGAVTVPIAPAAARSPGTVATGGVAFDPLTAGSTVVEATIPGFLTLPTGRPLVNVSAPGITMNSVETGSGMQRITSGSLGGSDHGGVTVTLTSSNPEVLVLSPDATTAGAASIEIFVPDGTVGFTFLVHGLEDVTGSPTVTASASGFTDQQTAFSVVQGAFDIIFLATSQTAGGADDPFEVRLGLANAQASGLIWELAARFGGPGFTAEVANSSAEVATLVTTEGTGQTVPVTVAPGQSRSPTTVGAGGVALRPLAPGSTTVTGTIPGLIRPLSGSVTVTVN